MHPCKLAKGHNPGEIHNTVHFMYLTCMLTHTRICTTPRTLTDGQSSGDHRKRHLSLHVLCISRYVCMCHIMRYTCVLWVHVNVTVGSTHANLHVGVKLCACTRYTCIVCSCMKMYIRHCGSHSIPKAYVSRIFGAKSTTILTYPLDSDTILSTKIQSNLRLNSAKNRWSDTVCSCVHRIVCFVEMKNRVSIDW